MIAFCCIVVVQNLTYAREKHLVSPWYYYDSGWLGVRNQISVNLRRFLLFLMFLGLCFFSPSWFFLNALFFIPLQRFLVGFCGASGIVFLFFFFRFSETLCLILFQRCRMLLQLDYFCYWFFFWFFSLAETFSVNLGFRCDCFWSLKAVVLIFFLGSTRNLRLFAVISTLFPQNFDFVCWFEQE